MLREIKSFVKNNLVNNEHPATGIIYYKLKALYAGIVQQRHRNMTYAEIEAYIGRQYEKMFGRPMDWDNPKTYNEKINVAKVYMPTPEKTRLADKLAVREWITGKIGAHYLIPLLGVYDSFDEIDFDALPDKFVMKCSHDSGSVTLVKDKSRMNRKLLKLKYDIAMKMDFAYMGFEMHYKDIKPKIIIEQYMGDAINDYKFLCPGGKPFACQVDFNRFTNHTRDFMDMKWEVQPFHQGNIPPSTTTPDEPKEYSEMVSIASELSRGFDQVRVDLYLLDGHIYFGEMTFSDGNGFAGFNPDEWDYKLGELWTFDNTIRRKILASRTKP